MHAHNCGSGEDDLTESVSDMSALYPINSRVCHATDDKDRTLNCLHNDLDTLSIT